MSLQSKSINGKPKTKDLIRFGYFPLELPPVFTTDDFGRARLSSIKKASFSYSESINFSIPRKGMSRRKLSIPNPAQYLELCSTIVKRYSEIKNFLSYTNSSTAPIYPSNLKAGERAVSAQHKYLEFLLKCFNLSHGTSYQLSADISRFYSTVYTHTLPWIIHGKETAKRKRNGKSLIGNELDFRLRNLQSGQTFGIPVGPDASHIIAEIICSAIDGKIRRRFPKLRFLRYRDDYRFFVQTKHEAEEVLRALDSFASELMLEINSDKTKIEEVPVTLEPEWVFGLRKFKFHDELKKQHDDLISFFSLALRYSREFVDAGVIKYAISVLRSLKVNNRNIELHIGLLFRLLSIYPGCFEDFAEILLRERDKVPKKLIEREMGIWFDKYVTHNCTYEILWGLWLCKVFEIKLKNTYAARILVSSDPLSILMVYDLKNTGLVSKTVSFRKIDKLVAESSFKDEVWILKYETLRRKWVKSQQNIKDPFFADLKKQKVSFYDSNATALKQKKGLPRNLGSIFAGLGLPLY